MHSIQCIGTEDSLLDCVTNNENSESCSDASVICQGIINYLRKLFIINLLTVTFTSYSDCDEGAVRLVGGSSEYEGRLEVCRSQTWGTVCDNGWNYQDAHVVCRQLGYQDSGICTQIHVYAYYYFIYCYRCKCYKQCSIWTRKRCYFILQHLLLWE